MSEETPHLTLGRITVEHFLNDEGGDAFSIAMSEGLGIVEGLGLLSMAQAYLAAPTIAAATYEDEE